MGVTVKGMNRAARFAVAIGVGLTAVEAQAGSVTVTFGALPNAVAIESYYNGGLSGYPPAGKGPDLGLVFSSLANEQKATTQNPPPRPGTGKFENNPSGAAGVLYFPYSASLGQLYRRRFGLHIIDVRLLAAQQCPSAQTRPIKSSSIPA